MEKLTSILAVAFDEAAATQVVDKAVALARRFQASVEVLVDQPQIAHHVSRHCASAGHNEVTLYSVPHANEQGNDAILRRAWSARPDLVVKAAAHAGGDWSLVEECPAPVLLVRGHAWEQPVRFATAVDVADNGAALARTTLHTAGFLALGVQGRLDILYSEREVEDESVRIKRAVRLAQLVREYHVGCERLQMYSGAPEVRLPALVAARRYDVLVLGADFGKGDAAENALIVARRLMAAAISDVVLVKAASAQPAAAAGVGSWREQRANQA